MTFDTDPNDQANISAADLAILVDQLNAARNALKEIRDEDLGLQSWVYDLINKALENDTTPATPTKVFLVIDGLNAPGRVMGVFSNEEEAELYADALGTKHEADVDARTLHAVWDGEFSNERNMLP